MSPRARMWAGIGAGLLVGFLVGDLPHDDDGPVIHHYKPPCGGPDCR